MQRWQEMFQTLTDEGLTHIVEHKYVAGAYTPLDNLLNPWWYFLANLLPRWLAPNLITCSGLVPLAVVYALHWLYCPFLLEPLPSWLYFAGAISLFVYQTLDAVDGKQARRIGASSPLGQLMDHGCDCLCSLSHHSQVMVVLLPGPSLLPMLVMTSLMTGFYLAQWEEYFTGVLNTSAGPFGVTELQKTVMALLLLAGSLGGDALEELMTHEAFPGSGVRVNHILMLLWFIFVGVMCALSIVRTWRRASERGQLQEAAGMLLPVVLVSAVALSWSRTAWLTSYRSVLYATGVEFVFITCKLIVVSMAKQSFPVSQWCWSVLRLLLAVGLSHTLAGAALEWTLCLFNALVSCIFGGWAVQTVAQIAKRLGIAVFSVKKAAAE